MAEANSLSDIAAFAHSLAREAGGQAIEWFRRPIDISKKDDKSPVTEADRKVEEEIRNKISERFPKHSIFGEEYGLQGGLNFPTWVIDPIDGTRSFISGSPLWGTLIALAENGKSSVGVIEMPALRESWTGISGDESWFDDAAGNRSICKVSDCRSLAEANFYTTSPFYFTDAERQKVMNIAEIAGMCRFGGDCYNYGLLASGHVDLVIESRLEPYDFMAIVPVIEGAGGIITDWEGRPLTLSSGKRVVAAATRELHDETLRLLA